MTRTGAIKKSVVFLILAIGLFFIIPEAFVHAQQNDQTIQKAFEGVKSKIDDLVNAKDSNSSDNLSIRIETFKKVLDLSTSEANDLKLKLLSFDEITDEDLLRWQSNSLDALKTALTYYDKEKQYVETHEKDFDLPAIQKLATDFKAWRDANYTETANEIRDFLLIQQEDKAIQTAKRRLQRITDDLKKLSDAGIKGINGLNKLLLSAGKSINEGASLNDDARKLFWNEYIIPLTTSSNATSTATSTSESSDTTSTPILPPLNATSTNATSTDASSTVINGQINLISSPPLPLSIKDEVKLSLNKIKGAYLIFIEMSNSVRELLK